MPSLRLSAYLEELGAHLRLDPFHERQVLREMHSHLQERMSELRARGLTEEEATETALQGLGHPHLLARELTSAHTASSWTEALLAAFPYLCVSLIFALQLWPSLAWLGIFMTTSVAATLYGWWRKKPLWMFPWAGFSLVLPLASGFIAGAAVATAAVRILHGQPTQLPLFVVLGLLAYVPLALWLIVSVIHKVVRFDWIFASLMLLPFPVLVRWFLSLQFQGSALAYDGGSISHEADAPIALVFLALSLLPIIVVRLQQRRVKVVALFLATPPSFLVAAHYMPGASSLVALALFTLLSIMLVAVPAVVDRRLGRHRTEGIRASVSELV